MIDEGNSEGREISLQPVGIGQIKNFTVARIRTGSDLVRRTRNSTVQKYRRHSRPRRTAPHFESSRLECQEYLLEQGIILKKKSQKS